MLKHLKQNKNIVLVALGLFLASMSVLFFFLKDDQQGHSELKANVVHSLALEDHQEEEKVYRELLHNEKDQIVIIGLDGIITFVSEDFKVKNGYTYENFKDTLLFSYLNPDDLPIFLEAFGKVISSEVSMAMVGPYRIKDGSGNYHFHIGSFHPMKEGEKVKEIAIATRDITDELQKESTMPEPHTDIAPIGTQTHEEKEESETETQHKSSNKKNKERKSNDESHLMADKLARRQ